MFTINDLKATIRKTDLKCIKKILDENPNFLSNIENMTLLYWLAAEQANENIKNPEEIVNFLLSNYEIDINQSNQEGSTALHEAVICEKLELVKILLENGAKIQANHGGNTPLHYAANRDYTEITALLIDEGANIYAKNNEGDTATHLAAAENNDLSTLTLLIKKAQNLSGLLLTKNNQQQTVFHIAKDRNNFDKLVEIALLIDPKLEIPLLNSENLNKEVQDKTSTAILHEELAGTKTQPMTSESQSQNKASFFSKGCSKRSMSDFNSEQGEPTPKIPRLT